MIDPLLAEDQAPVSARVLRQFAVSWLLIFGGLASWQAFGRDRLTWAFVLAVLALPVGVQGLVKPTAIRPIFQLLMVLAFPLEWIVSNVLLIVLFYIIFTPVAFLFKFIGRDPLSRRHRADQQTYWGPQPATKDVRSYLRQT